jgi:hypothetical protein
MTTVSLAKDGDINIANNYAQEDYFAFYSREDFPRLKLGLYGREGRRGKGHIYPINLPGISVLPLPFYWLSRLFTGRWLTFVLKTGLAAWASLLGLQLYLYARERWEDERLSLGLWALFSFSAPVLFYAVHLYPEVPVACLMVAIFRKITGRGPLSPFTLALCGTLLGALPWLGLKFSFFLAVVPISLISCSGAYVSQGRLFRLCLPSRRDGPLLSLCPRLRGRLPRCIQGDDAWARSFTATLLDPPPRA